VLLPMEGMQDLEEVLVDLRLVQEAHLDLLNVCPGVIKLGLLPCRVRLRRRCSGN
jgi:hypothetical protein